MTPLIEFKNRHADEPMAKNLLMVCVVTRIRWSLLYAASDERMYNLGADHTGSEWMGVNPKAAYRAMVLRNSLQTLQDTVRLYSVSSPRSKQPEFHTIHRKIVRDLNDEFINRRHHLTLPTLPVSGVLGAIPTATIEEFKEEYYDEYERFMKNRKLYTELRPSPRFGSRDYPVDSFEAKMTVAPAYKFWLETLQEYSMLKVEWA